ncbi:phage tail protein [Burkholderia stagnalis]|uniref:phage tail protein n=1 Tax=Burkholderia stagnalis TaxID=1503054 RepID=UPI00075EACBA|nr:phage tail protein [Burkholderia stagnalis]KVC58908.1 phage tail protein [Burkholderia stagnalis]KVN21757.1 phage tail protein [Burkholderia stagnalis]
MIKPAGLRAAIVAAIPSLRGDPDKLTVFIDQGSIAATGARSLSFEYRYVCNVLLLDFGGDPDALFVALLDWVRHNQPDLVLNPDEHASGITYEIDVLNNKTADVSIKVQLTESVVVKVADDGKRTVEHVDDSKLQDSAGPWVAEPWTI